MDQFYSVIYWLGSMTKIATEGGRFSQATVTSRDREASEMDLICGVFFGLLLLRSHLHAIFLISFPPLNEATSHSSAITHKKV